MKEIKKFAVYTSREVEEILRISPSTLKRLIKRGSIKGPKVGGQYRFLGEELLRLLSPEAVNRAGSGIRTGLE